MERIPALCPGCRNVIDIEPHEIVCAACGERIEAPFDVPVLVEGGRLERVAPPPEKFIADIAMAVGAPDAIDAIREAYSLKLALSTSALQAESDQFAHRLCVDEHVSPDAPLQDFGGPKRRVNVVAELHVALEPLVLPSAFEAGGHAGINVRITNLGGCWISTDAEPAARLSYRLRKLTNERRSISALEVEGVRTELLIEVAPGRTFTQAVFLQMPSDPGTYELSLAVVLEGACWAPNASPPVRIEVSWKLPRPRYTQNLEGPHLDYVAQHNYGVKLFKKWLATHVAAENPQVLEIGGNIWTASEELVSGKFVNVDIDLHALLTRSIARKDRVKSVAADGMNLPFPNGCFDAIVMFATFHHFLDPVGLLRHIRDKINKSGIICLMCEPIGHVRVEHDYKAFVEELNRGVCEQSFETWEYEAMLDQAGLQIIEAVFDRGAAMIAAQPKGVGHAKPVGLRALAKSFSRLGLRFAAK